MLLARKTPLMMPLCGEEIAPQSPGGIGRLWIFFLLLGLIMLLCVLTDPTQFHMPLCLRFNGHFPGEPGLAGV